jgi:hypothetical protein
MGTEMTFYFVPCHLEYERGILSDKETRLLCPWKERESEFHFSSGEIQEVRQAGWLTAIIPSSGEADIERTRLAGQKLKTLSQ